MLFRRSSPVNGSGSLSVLVPVELPPLSDQSLYILNAVVRYTRRCLYSSRDDPETWIPLATRTFLRPTVGDDYRKHLDPLLSDGILECDEDWWFSASADVNGKCKYYRRTAPWRVRAVERRPLRSRQLQTNVARHNAKEGEQVLDPLHFKLRQWVRQIELAPDAPYGVSPLVDRWLDDEFWFVVDPQGRIHSPVTTLPREFRGYVRIGDYRDFTAVDVANCQPLLLALSLSEPQQTFTERCLDGSLYERLMLRTGYSREVVKERFLAVAYGKPEHGNTRMGTTLDEEFPGLRTAIYKLGDGRRRAVRMQILESTTMIQGAAARFVQAHPKVPILTVHDCLVVPSPYAAGAADLVRDAWARSFGLSPKLECKKWE